MRSQTSGVVPSHWESRRAISTETPVLPFNSLDRVTREIPSCRAVSVTLIPSASKTSSFMPPPGVGRIEASPINPVFSSMRWMNSRCKYSCQRKKIKLNEVFTSRVNNETSIISCHSGGADTAHVHNGSSFESIRDRTWRNYFYVFC